MYSKIQIIFLKTTKCSNLSFGSMLTYLVRLGKSYPKAKLCKIIYQNHLSILKENMELRHCYDI